MLLMFLVHVDAVIYYWTFVFIGGVARGGASVRSTFRARIREMTGVWVMRLGRMNDCDNDEINSQSVTSGLVILSYF